jgi:molybdopterin synthase catalytic subunit
MVTELMTHLEKDGASASAKKVSTANEVSTAEGDSKVTSNHLIAFSESQLLMQEAYDHCQDALFGACSVFAGVVRKLNVGRTVTGIDYEGFESLGLHILQKIAQEAEELVKSELRVIVKHRVGHLKVGDVSVLVGTGSVHRDEACVAMRYIIEELKHRAPIWKFEHYVDGNSGWVKGHSLCQHRKTSSYFMQQEGE